MVGGQIHHIHPLRMGRVPCSQIMVESMEGATIEHQRFGIGKVLKIEGLGENVKATVEFRNTGTKQLLLKFAKYKVL